MIPYQQYQNLISIRHINKKITTLLTDERHVLVSNYFCTHVCHLLDFDTNDIVSFNIKYFFFFRDGIPNEEDLDMDLCKIPRLFSPL